MTSTGTLMPGAVAIVTGASQGIGRSTAIRLARDFSSIVLAARNASALADVASAVKSAGAEPLACELDLSDPASADALVSRTLERLGRIDALLNGIARYGTPEEIAELLAFMVSPHAKWMTGASVRMDGGEIKGI